ncbi:MAG: type II secretion system protein GspN [Leptonema sp. (in: Bacteria)]|nr:type II secretion system protein GspN [Leptonema sp. (in: bacteria)]
MNSDQEQGNQENNYESDEYLDESTKLTKKQLTWLIAGGAISFILSFIILFPFDGIIRSSLKSQLPPEVRLEFTNLDLGFFGQTKVEALSIQNEPAFGLEAETVVADIKKLALLRFSPKGKLRLNSGSFNVGSTAASYKAIEITADLNDVRRPASQWEGNIMIRVQQLEPEELPSIISNLPIAADELTVSRITLPLQFQNGQLNFGKSRLQSSLFTVSLEGSGRLSNQLAATMLDAKLCIKPVEDIEEKNPKMHELYIMAGGATGGELCMKLTGLLASPTFTPIETAPAQ